MASDEISEVLKYGQQMKVTDARLQAQARRLGYLPGQTGLIAERRRALERLVQGSNDQIDEVSGAIDGLEAALSSLKSHLGGPALAKVRALKAAGDNDLVVRELARPIQRVLETCPAVAAIVMTTDDQRWEKICHELRTVAQVSDANKQTLKALQESSFSLREKIKIAAENSNREAVDEVKKQLETAKVENKILQQRIRIAQEGNDQLTQQFNTSDKRNKTLEKQIQTAKVENEQLKEQIKTATTDNDKLTEGLQTALREKKLLTQQSNATNGENGKLTQQIKTANGQLETVKRKFDSVEDDLEICLAEIGRGKRQKQDLVDALASSWDLLCVIALGITKPEMRFLGTAGTRRIFEDVKVFQGMRLQVRTMGFFSTRGLTTCLGSYSGTSVLRALKLCSGNGIFAMSDLEQIAHGLTTNELPTVLAFVTAFVIRLVESRGVEESSWSASCALIALRAIELLYWHFENHMTIPARLLRLLWKVRGCFASILAKGIRAWLIARLTGDRGCTLTSAIQGLAKHTATVGDATVVADGKSLLMLRTSSVHHIWESQHHIQWAAEAKNVVTLHISSTDGIRASQEFDLGQPEAIDPMLVFPEAINRYLERRGSSTIGETFEDTWN